MIEKNLIILSGNSPNFAYLCNEYLEGAILISYKNKKKIYCHEINKGLLKTKKMKYEVCFFLNKKEIKKIMEKINLKNIKTDKYSIDLVKNLFKQKIKIEDISNFFKKKRMEKTKEQIKKFKKALKITREIMKFTKENIKKDMSENDIASLISKKIYEKGFKFSFDPIISCDFNSRFAHFHPTNKKIKKMVMLDFGIKYFSISTDITRCHFLENENENYKKVKEIFYEILDKIPSLKKWSEVSYFSKYLYEKKMIKYPPHSIGHGIGYLVHEPPEINDFSLDKISKNQIFTIEPSIYFKNYGVRFEEVCIFDGKKAKILK